MLSIFIIFFIADIGFIDAQNRVTSYYNINLLQGNALYIIIQEPLIFLIAGLLDLIGLLSFSSLQISLLGILIILSIKILKERVIFLPIFMLIPNFALLFFNTQAIAISLLISYTILMTRFEIKLSLAAFLKDSFFLLVAIGFHWVSIIFIPILLIKHKRYNLIIFSTFGIGIFFSIILALINLDLLPKLNIYKDILENKNSVIHVQVTLFATLFFVFLNYIFRQNNLVINFHNLLFLYLVAIVIISVEIFGYKAASRLAFALDLWLLLDLLIFWVPYRLAKSKFIVSFRNKNHITYR